jgi:hypothetical protein
VTLPGAIAPCHGHPRESGDPVLTLQRPVLSIAMSRLDSRLRGNDGVPARAGVAASGAALIMHTRSDEA